MDLLAENRQIVMKGPLKRKGTGSESLALQVYLLDHCLIITKQKFVDDVEHIKLYKKVTVISSSLLERVSDCFAC